MACLKRRYTFSSNYRSCRLISLNCQVFRLPNVCRKKYNGAMDPQNQLRHNPRDRLPPADETPHDASQASGSQSCPSAGAHGAAGETRSAGGPIGGQRIEEEIAHLVFELAGRSKARVGTLLTQLDLTVPQAWLLLSLDRPLSMGEVASRVRADPSTVTWLVDRLEARGLLERRPHAGDRRVKQLVLTAEGGRVREHLHSVFADVPGLSALSPVQLQTLHDLLRRAVGGCS
jgi:DNA-binding MarR family transcriptional regulator